nr:MULTISPECIES: AtpZ/AtpI family protein [Bacillus]
MHFVKKIPYQAMALTSVVVSHLVGSLLIGVFGGKWIDSKLSTEPLFLIIGLLLGVVLGFFGIIRVLKDKIQGD